MAVAVLKTVAERLGLPTVRVLRTRDPEQLKDCNILVDVGGKYEPAGVHLPARVGSFQGLPLRADDQLVVSPAVLDHHQKGGAGVRPNGVPFAAAGLTWKHFGPTLGLGETIIQRVDEHLMQYIDAVDNGVDIAVTKPEFEQAGLSSAYSLSDAVASVNPLWNEPHEPKDFDAAFQRGVELCAEVLNRCIKAEKAVREAEAFVDAAVVASPDQLLVLDSYVPWAERVVKRYPEILFVVYPSPEKEWMVQGVPPTLGSFAQRKPLPGAWAGLRDEKLAALTSVEDAIFCHKARFICGARSKEGALRMAQLALSE
jgi:uncharacterized UPF0160 family protein